VSVLVEFFGELLSLVPERAVFRLGEWVLKRVGFKNPEAYPGRCVATGFLIWLILFIVTLAFLAWLF